MLTILRFLVPFVLLWFPLGCSRLGTGIVLWPPEDGQWEAGDLLTINDESRLRSSYIITDPETREKAELDTWRLRFFSKAKDAEKWLPQYLPWKDIYAESTRQGLPLRTEPSSTADQVYKLRDGEILKVLKQEGELVTVADTLEGHWYHLLTESGLEAYGFDYYLRVFRKEGKKRVYLNEEETTDPILEDFFSAPWRPDYYASMVSGRRIDLRSFREEYGLFFDREKKTLTLRNQEHEVIETWTKTVSLGRNRYDFVGTSFRVTLPPSGFASVQYIAEGKELNKVFIRLEGEVKELIEQEVSRRMKTLKDFIALGNLYRSRSYGELSFDETGRFVWIGKSSLISRNMVSADTGSTGIISFDHFMDLQIADNHEGVLTFRFDSGQMLNFLYGFENGGLRLLFVPPQEVERMLVSSDQFIYPIRIFFVPQLLEDEAEITLLDQG